MRISELNSEYVVSEYRKGTPTYVIANQCGTTHHTIKRLLKSLNEPLRDKRESHRVGFQYTPTEYRYNGEIVYRTSSGRLCIVKEYNGSRATFTLVKEHCHNCGKEILSAKSNRVKRRACSDACHYAMQSGEKNVNWKGPKKIKYTGHILIYCPDHPHAHQNKVPEHRLVMEKSLGRYLLTDEIVHHINGVKDDNRLENLILCTKSEHSIAHNSLNALLKGLLDDEIIRFNPIKKIYERVK